jgi:hypothetical protein
MAVGFQIVAALGLMWLGSGCQTEEMKGTPFYSGDSGKRPGAVEQRVNVWPLFYYCDPAWSVLWPVLESTDDHTAVRPLFSVYGLDRTNREYNVLWPLAQFDREARENRVFPVFWGDHYFDVFPVYWHSGHPWGDEGGSDSLFPLWILERSPTNAFDLWSPWPLVRVWHNREAAESGSMVLPLYWHGRDARGSMFASLFWVNRSDRDGGWWHLVTPVYYQSSNATASVLATPFWAQGRSETNDWRAIIPFCYWDRQQHTLVSPLWAYWRADAETERWLAPCLLSWGTRGPDASDLWLVGGLAKASWGPKPNMHYAFPIYYRDATNQILLSPLFGWNREAGYWYPFTPIFGMRTGPQSGGWFFPLYNRERDRKTGDVSDNYLLLGSYQKTRTSRRTSILPLFYDEDSGPLDSTPPPGVRHGNYGRTFWCLPICWYQNRCSVHPARPPAEQTRSETQTTSAAISVPVPATPDTNAPLVREYLRKSGAFPLWSSSTRTIPAEGRRESEWSVLLWLYDYKRTIAPSASLPSGTNDYTRSRVLWRLWHGERLNGDVSVDVFPTVTYDRKVDGCKKVAFLWRFFRYERKPGSDTKLDLLFIPILR